jgi:predicted acyltransferase (DUF342 family)
MFTFSMFRGRVKAPAGERDGSNDRSHSTIGENLAITGNVTSGGEVHVNGRIHGDIHCVSLVFAEGSHIEGNVTAEDVIVRGRVLGSVRAFRVTLESGCHVAKPRARQKKESTHEGKLESKADKPTDEAFSLSRRLAFEAKVRK